MQRFILTLRQLNHTANKSNSDAQHFSRFSVSFRMPSDFLGNIGEPLDHGRSERVEDNGDDDNCVVEELRDELEEGFAHLPGPLFAYRYKLMKSDAVLVLQSGERASDDDIIGSFACSRETVVVPSTTAH